MSLQGREETPGQSMIGRDVMTGEQRVLILERQFSTEARIFLWITSDTKSRIIEQTAIQSTLMQRL